jgi:hypothetical protein
VGRRYYSAKYNNAYLNQHVGDGFLDLPVMCHEYNGDVRVRLILGDNA